MTKSTFLLSVLGLGAGLATALITRRWHARSLSETELDDQFTGAFPRNSGAENAVIGGSPEDMNMMPATGDFLDDGPIYDGHTLSRGAL